MTETENQEAYWTKRYVEQNTGWDLGSPSTPLKTYIDQLEDKQLKILVPGAGNAYEAEYMHQQGFTNVYVLDISKLPLDQFQQRVPDFPARQLLHKDFFELVGQFDLVLEQTFFCSLEPTGDNRRAYAEKMHQLLNPSGKLVGLWFKHPLTMESRRPFGGSKEEYKSYLTPYFDERVFEDCYNSIPPRMGNELFGIFERGI
ncbi:MAG: methyltransferase domain-containing protein [Cytophagales bacterium]|nr:methyltransferase domain-containing protein [Cytophagales bacterium]